VANHAQENQTGEAAEDPERGGVPHERPEPR
jgi:hypothetical protein